MATTPDLSDQMTPAGPRKVDNFRGILFMLLGAILISCLHALVRDMTQELHPFEVAFFRNVVALVVLTLVGAEHLHLRGEPTHDEVEPEPAARDVVGRDRHLRRHDGMHRRKV